MFLKGKKLRLRYVITLIIVWLLGLMTENVASNVKCIMFDELQMDSVYDLRKTFLKHMFSEIKIV